MPNIPFRTKITYRILAVGFPFLLIIIIEIFLRSFYPFPIQKPELLKDWGNGVQPAAGMLSPPLLIENEGQVYPSSQLKDFISPFSFSRIPSKKRIVCLGGSATLGVPFETNPEKTFPSQLKTILQQLEYDVEVINMGGASFGSDHVLTLGMEALKYQPDVLVVYSGNNEFFNHILSIDHLNRDWVPQQIPTLHLIAYIQRWLNLFPTAKETQNHQSDRWQKLLSKLIDKPEYVNIDALHRQDPIQEQVAKRYIHNFKKLYHHAQKNDVQVIFAVLPSNLHTEPAISLSTPKPMHRTPQQNSKFCSPLYQKTNTNPWNAMGWYHLAQCLQEHQQPTKKYYEAARDLDMLPGRPNAFLNTMLMKTDLPLLLIEMEKENFHDSCHLTEQGYKHLAEQFSQEIVLRWNFSKKIP